jgi:PAS domain S-box-containing protein
LALARRAPGAEFLSIGEENAGIRGGIWSSTMTLKARLTLGSALMATLIAGAISAVNLARVTHLEFGATLERARLMEKVAVERVTEALNRQRSAPLPDALRDPELSRALVNVLTASRDILEVAVVSPGNAILADSDQSRVGSTTPKYPDFGDLVEKTGWLQMARLLASGGGHYYQLERPLGAQGQTLIYVRVIVAPALISLDIEETLASAASVSLLAIAGAALIASLASAVTFRKLGQIGRMLDLAATGELEPEQTAGGAAGGDELSVMASKVNLLGQRLRGAQFEVFDLRGNIDRLLQELEDAVFIFNREGRLIFASGSVERFLGAERAQLAGRTIAEVFPPSTSLGRPIGETARTGHPVRDRRVELAPAAEGGTAPAAVLLSVDVLERLPGTAGSGSGVLVRLRDPEAQRNIGRHLQLADRLAAMSRVTGGVAHEVKNPLNAILLHMEVVRAKMARGDADIAQPMEIISREILRLDRVVKTFLDFTKPVDLKFANVDLRSLMEEVAQLARPLAAASNIQVESQWDIDGVEARADRDLLKQAVLNVVMNAIEAMPGGGSLRLEAAANRETAELRISDTGGGIPPELREKVFRLYFTTKPKGSGIGLATTFRIVQLQDGTIDFTSEPGKGTTFLIRLPIAA